MKKKTKEIIENLKKIDECIVIINREVTKPKGQMNYAVFMEANENYKHCARKVNTLFSERKVLLDKWIDDLNIQLQKHVSKKEKENV